MFLLNLSPGLKLLLVLSILAEDTLLVTVAMKLLCSLIQIPFSVLLSLLECVLRLIT